MGLEKGPLVLSKSDVGCKEPEKNKKKRERNMKVRIGSSRIVDFVFSVPLSLPMVFLVRSYVHAVHIPRLGGGLDGGRIANQVLDEPNYHSTGWT